MNIINKVRSSSPIEIDVADDVAATELNTPKDSMAISGLRTEV